MTFCHATTFLEAMLCNSCFETGQGNGWHAAHEGEATRMVGARTPRLLVGMDGSLDVQRALADLCLHPLAAWGQARVVTVLDPRMAKRRAVLLPALARWDGEGGHVEESEDADEDDFDWISGRVEAASEQLHHAGFAVSQTTREGDFLSVLLDEARMWKPDCILVGALSPLDLSTLPALASYSRCAT